MEQRQDPRKVGTIIWGTLVAGVVAFLGVSLYLHRSGRGPANAELAGALLPVAAGMTIVTVALSWLWAVRMRPRLPPGAPPQTPGELAMVRLVVASALCEGSALFAIVVFVATRDPILLAPLALSFLALLAHHPGDRHWGRLTGARPDRPASDARSNRMIRGG